MLLSPQMKAVIEVKFCHSPLQQDVFQKQVLWTLTDLKCDIIPMLIFSTGKVEMSLATVVGFPFFMHVSKTES